ncbi:hypothetical protein BKN67_16990 [Salmonella enterica]|nr:hypothetical protein [Salmonella enterica]
MFFELFVPSWLKISSVDVIRKQFKHGWNVVDGIMIRAVKRRLAWIKRPLSARHSNVDEPVFKKDIGVAVDVAIVQVDVVVVTAVLLLRRPVVVAGETRATQQTPSQIPVF